MSVGRVRAGTCPSSARPYGDESAGGGAVPAPHLPYAGGFPVVGAGAAGAACSPSRVCSVREHRHPLLCGVPYVWWASLSSPSSGCMHISN